MLSQIVSPMVRSQLQLLASSRQAIRPKLVGMISQWLGFLGVRAQVTQLEAEDGQIHACLTVDKPAACDIQDWRLIVGNLSTLSSDEILQHNQPSFSPHQQSTLARFYAYLIQAGAPEVSLNWEAFSPQLQALGLDESMQVQIHSALRVSQNLDQLTEHLDLDLVVFALPKALSIALLDHQINPAEEQAISWLYQSLKQTA